VALTRKHKTVTEGAFARLQALQEFSQLGSGYSLAFRDLQIRGAGDLLGAKQSGTMVTVGYELYSQLINEAVSALKNTVDGVPAALQSIDDPLATLEPLPAFDLPVVALLPESYVRDQAQRLYYYQQMMSSRDVVTLAAVHAEVEDRYGKPPAPVRNAFSIMELRMRARPLRITKLDGADGMLRIKFAPDTNFGPRVFQLVKGRNARSGMQRDEFVWPYEGDPIRAVESMLQAFEKAIAQVQNTPSAYSTLAQ
jgi:transcription-repair coupling factor (superfamily II helicase)